MHTDQPGYDIPQDAPDPRVARAEVRLAMLRELSDLGMALTRDLTRRALAAPETAEPAVPADDTRANARAPASTRPAAGPRHDPAESFARLSRAIRLTLAQEAKAETAPRVLIDGDDDPAWDSHDLAAANDNFRAPADPCGRNHASAHRNRIRDHVFEAINAEVSDVYKAHEVLDDLHERLAEGERYDAFVFRPVREAVEAICEDLGLHPDWSRWTDEGWPPPPPDAPRHVWQSCWAPGYSKKDRARWEQ
jgi:hypothetical protein